MPKVTIAVIGLMLLPPFVQTQSPPKSAASQKRNAIAGKIDAKNHQFALDLLKQGHALNEQVDAMDKAELLNAQIITAGRLDKQLAKTWAQELFDLGASGKTVGLGLAQFWAINSLAMNDPDDALVLLAQVEPAAIAPQNNEFPGANGAIHMTQTLFSKLVQQNGKVALPRVLEVADSLGEKGRYPYSGVMKAAIAARDTTLIESTARDLLIRFQQRLDPPACDYDFAEMLSDSESHWPKELLKPAVIAAVEAIEQYPVTEKNRNFTVTYRGDETSSTAHGPVEMGLLKIAFLVKRVDPERWMKILSAYPSLSSAPSKELLHSGSTVTLSVSGAGGGTDSEDAKSQALSEIRRLARTDTDRAEKAISAISDSAIRAEALVILAQATASSNPEKSVRISAEAEQIAMQMEDLEMQFRSACARLQSHAASNNHLAMPQDLNDAFQLGDKVMRKARDEGEDARYLAGPLVEAVRSAIKIEPEMTVANIELVYLPYEKAQMLTAAAFALAPQMTSPRQPEQANKQLQHAR